MVSEYRRVMIVLRNELSLYNNFSNERTRARISQSPVLGMHASALTILFDDLEPIQTVVSNYLEHNNSCKNNIIIINRNELYFYGSISLVDTISDSSLIPHSRLDLTIASPPRFDSLIY